MLLLVAVPGLYPAVRVSSRAGSSRASARARTVHGAGGVGRHGVSARARLGGFPWVPLGNSQVTVLPVAQLASVLGVYGLSALVAYINTRSRLHCSRGRIGSEWSPSRVRSSCLSLSAAGVLGASRDGSLTREGTPITGRSRPGQHRAGGQVESCPGAPDLHDLHRDDARRGPPRRGVRHLAGVVHAVHVRRDPPPIPRATQLRELAREVRVPILFGSDQIVRAAGHRRSSYNAAFQLDPDGKTVAVYRKIHLVPFGEFFPFQRLDCPSSRRWSSGSCRSRPAPARCCCRSARIGRARRSATRSSFRSLVRDAVRAGSELLTTITNDGWYGRSSAPYQHFEMASMRAIEQGRYLARAANTGISGIVDPYGRCGRSRASSSRSVSSGRRAS